MSDAGFQVTHCRGGCAVHRPLTSLTLAGQLLGARHWGNSGGQAGLALALGEPAPMSRRSAPNKNTEKRTTTVSVRNRVREDAWGRKGEALSSEMRGRGSHTKTWGGWCSRRNSGTPRQEAGGAGQTAQGFSHGKECGFFLLCATEGLKHGNDRS